MEIVEAVPGWFDLAARTIEILATETFRPKDRDALTVPLTDQFVDFLKRWGLRSPFVLQPDVTHGSHRYRFDFRRAFGEYMKVQGVPWISPHVMRHSFASICASKASTFTESRRGSATMCASCSAIMQNSGRTIAKS